MVKAVLTEANKNADFRSPAILMSLAATYYRVTSGLPEFLQHQLKDLDIWQNNHYWEASFFEAIEEERKNLPDKIQNGDYDWDTLSNEERVDVLREEENIIFSVLGSYAFHMINLGVDAQTASMFIARTCSLSLLTDDHTATLHALVDNINRVALQNEQMTAGDKKTDDTEKKKQHPSNIFTPPESVSERAEARELYQRIIEFRRAGPGLKDHPSRNKPPAAPYDSKDDDDDAPPPPMEPSDITERRDGYTVKTLKANRGGIDSMVLHPNLSAVICGTSSGAICVWKMGDHKFLTALEGHEDRVSCLSCDKKSLHFASGSYDKTVRVWGVHEDGSWLCDNTFTDHTGSIACLEIRGSYVISGSFDNSLKLYLRAGRCVGSLNGHTGVVMCVQFDDIMDHPQDGASALLQGSFPYIVSGSRDTSVRIWDVRTLRPVHALTEHTDWVRRVQFDANRVVSGSYDCTLKVWDPTTGKCNRTLAGHTGSINCFQYSVEQKVLVSGSGDCTIKVWDLDSGSCMRTLKGHTDEVVCLKLAGTKLVSGSFDHSVRLWDITQGKCDRVLRGHSDWVYSLDVQSNQIYSSSWDATLKIWEIDDMALRKSQAVPALNLTTMKESKELPTNKSASNIPASSVVKEVPTKTPSKTKFFKKS